MCSTSVVKSKKGKSKMFKCLVFSLRFPWISPQREQQHSSQTVSPTDCENCSIQQRQWNLIWLIRYFELSLTILTLHVFHQNKKHLLDTTSLPTMSLSQAAKGLPGKQHNTEGRWVFNTWSAMFCLLSATLERIHKRKSLNSVLLRQWR